MQKLRQVGSLLKTPAPETSDISGIPGGPPPQMMPQQVNGHLTGGPPMMHPGPMGYPQHPMMAQRMPMPPMRNPETGMIMSPEEQQHWLHYQQQRRQDEQQRAAAAAAQFHQQQRMPMHPSMGYMMGPRGPMIRPGGEMMHPAMMRAVAPPPPPQQVAPPPTTTKGKKRKNNQAPPPPPPPQPQLMQMAPAPHQMRMMGPGAGGMMYDEYGGPMMGHPMPGPRPMMAPMNPHQQHEMMMMQQQHGQQHVMPQMQQQHGQQHMMPPMQQRPHMPSHMPMGPAPPMGAMYANGPPAAAPLPNPQQSNDIFSGTSEDDLAVLSDLYNSTAGDDIFSNIEPFLYDRLPPSVSAQTPIASQTATAASNTPKFAQFHQQGAKAMVAVGGPMQIDLQHQQPDCRNLKISKLAYISRSSDPQRAFRQEKIGIFYMQFLNFQNIKKFVDSVFAHSFIH